MNNRKIIKGYKTLISSKFNVDTSIDKFKDGIIYTLYSDEFDSVKVGFAENDQVLEKKLNYLIYRFPISEKIPLRS